MDLKNSMGLLLRRTEYIHGAVRRIRMEVLFLFVRQKGTKPKFQKRVRTELEMLPIPAWNRLRNMDLALLQQFLSAIPAPALFMRIRWNRLQ